MVLEVVLALGTEGRTVAKGLSVVQVVPGGAACRRVTKPHRLDAALGRAGGTWCRGARLE